jgi:hypothetical protein
METSSYELLFSPLLNAGNPDPDALRGRVHNGGGSGGMKREGSLAQPFDLSLMQIL